MRKQNLKKWYQLTHDDLMILLGCVLLALVAGQVPQERIERKSKEFSEIRERMVNGK